MTERAAAAQQTLASDQRATDSRMTAGKALLACLIREGVEVVFGYPGGAILPVYDELYKETGLRHILTRHEQGAVHAADGYARTTGRPGVCLATSGPGATNLVTGLATAMMDSIPLVAITGQVGTGAIGSDAFQEADIRGITMPVTKHNYLVDDPEDVPRIVKEAFHIATTGRPGPVLIDLPKNVANAVIDFHYPDRVELPGYKPTTKGHPKQILETVGAIAAASRPVLYVGGGAILSGAADEVRELAAQCNIPVTTTLMAQGIFPEDDPLSLGMLGMHGTVYANYAVDASDLLIAVGARFDDRVTGNLERFARGAKVVHIDIDPAEIGKNRRPDIPLVGDVKEVLTQLVQRVAPKREQSWLDQIAEWKREYPLWYDETTDAIKPQAVVEQIGKLTGGDAVVTTDVGQHQMWAAQWCRFRRPRTHVTSGGLGTMGFGFPAAIGAAFGRRDVPVIAVTGDGGFLMNIQELATAAAHRIPVKVVIVNNFNLGMVRQWQELIYERRYSHSGLADNPDFVKIADGFGVPGRLVRRKSELTEALEWMLAEEGPVVLDVHVDPEENCFPMIPAGGSVDQMVGKKGWLE